MKTQKVLVIPTLTLLLLAAMVVGCSNSAFRNLTGSILNSTGSTKSSPLSDEQEYYLGRSVAAVLLSKYSLSHDSGTSHYAESVASVLAAVSDRPEIFGGYHVAIVDTNDVSAFSAPGGFILISRGFLKLLPNEDALAAVLAHEIGHIVKADGVNAISKANLNSAQLAVGTEAGRAYSSAETREIAALLSDSVTEVVDTLLKKGYSRSQEYEADEYAAALLSRAGYTSSALGTVLEALAADKNRSGVWFTTHPAPEKRLSEVKSAFSDSSSASKNMALRTERFNRNMKRKS